MFDYRALTEADAEAWRALRLEGVRDFPLGFLITVEEAAEADLDRCRSILAAGASRGLFREGTLVGFCGFRPQKPLRIRHRAEVGPFFVAGRHQGTGAARAMLAGVIAEAEGADIAQLELTVSPDNRRAVAFYEREGFERYGCLPDAVRMEGAGSDELFYRLRIMPRPTS